MDLNLDKMVSNSAKQGFFVGAMIGAIAWIIGSPILGKLLGDYATGDCFGKVTGAILMGVFVFNFVRRDISQVVKVLMSVVIAGVTYAVIHYGNFTLVFKGVVDSFMPNNGDNTWAFSFLLSYGVLGFLVGGFMEAFLHFQKEST